MKAVRQRGPAARGAGGRRAAGRRRARDRRRRRRHRAIDEPQGTWLEQYFISFANTISAGSSEIQRNIIAEQVLGLPR